jgi:hypothetical protein
MALNLGMSPSMRKKITLSDRFMLIFFSITLVAALLIIAGAVWGGSSGTNLLQIVAGYANTILRVGMPIGFIFAVFMMLSVKGKDRHFTILREIDRLAKQTDQPIPFEDIVESINRRRRRSARQSDRTYTPIKRSAVEESILFILEQQWLTNAQYDQTTGLLSPKSKFFEEAT